MDVIRDSIESRADDVCRAKEELRTTPVYPHSAAYASEHGEMTHLELFRYPEPHYVLFDYQERNPLNYEAKVQVIGYPIL